MKNYKEKTLSIDDYKWLSIDDYKWLSIDDYKWLSIDDYKWLSDAVDKWQYLFSVKLNIKKDVHEMLRLSEILNLLETVRNEIPERNLLKHINDNAYYIGQSRKQFCILSKIANLENIAANPNRIHEIVPSSQKEQDEDWYKAEVYFAMDVLDGKINFAYKIPTNSYKYLEDVWLKDLKQIKAYHLWEGTGNRTDSNSQKYYLDACKEIHELLLGSKKIHKRSFSVVSKYLKDQYLALDGKSLDANKWRINEGYKAREMIEKKTRRIMDITEMSDWDKSKSQAEKYVKMFYENIIPAVIEEKEESVDKVLDAFRYSKAQTNRYLIINAFEAALVIYFLKSKQIEDSCKRCNLQLNDII